MIDENTDAYNEGKALLSKIEPLMPLLNTYVKFRDGSIAKLPGFDSAQAWFAGKVAPLAERMGLTIPADVTDFPVYVQNMVAEGQAMLKQYEDGLAELEAGMALVDEYTMVCYKNEPIYRHNGEMAVPGPEQRLGADFDWKKYDENGNLVTLRNGEPYLDLDQCLEVCKSFRESVDHHVADVTNELYMRLGLYVALAVTAILGIIGGILGLVGKRGAFVLGIITAVLTVGCNIFGLLTRYHGYTYPLKDGSYSGTLQLIAIITFALVSVVFLIVTAAAKNEAEKQARIEA